MKIHLVGMGLMGCFIALRLEELGVDWSWEDNNSQVVAWKASTGAIFPSADPVDERCRQVWVSRSAESSWQPFLERATWWYTTKSPPHGAKTTVVETRGLCLKRASEDAVHLNAQTFVPAIRSRFLHLRKMRCPLGRTVVVTHGFGPRLHRLMWGWNVRVAIDLPTQDLRGAVYVRLGRFQMAYAYPVPGEPWWYAGSSLISQSTASDLQVLPKFERWRALFEKESGVRVTRVGPATSGWRPVPADDDHQEVRKIGGRLCVLPHWHNGIRRSPHVVSVVERVLGL